MPNKQDKLFGILEELSDYKRKRYDILDQFEDLEPDPYPQAKSSKHKWYKRFRKSPTENLEDFIKSRPEKAAKRLEDMDEYLNVMSSENAPLDKKIEAALNLWTFKVAKKGFWTQTSEPESESLSESNGRR